MTFYWWSHWFWITLLSNILFATIVCTYPSQEITTEYNQNIKIINTVTKLFQTSPTSLWTTSTPTSAERIMDLTQSGGISHDEIDETVEKDPTDVDEVEEAVAIEIESGKNEIQKSQDETTYMDENSEEYEFKRSAEIDKNKTQKIVESKNNTETKSFLNDTHDSSAIKTIKKPTVTITEDDDSLNGSLIKPNINNNNNNNNNNSDTSFSNNFNNLSTNLTNDNITLATPTTINSNSPPSAPSAPHIDNDSVAAEWLHTEIIPPAVLQPNIGDISSNLVTAASASQKVPFTLENVNKKDEIIRAESEQRSRKSKVLSAEYKHRYINYSSDPKSLLTRSASTAPNDFDGDNENNISSEALAIQRTYFLDAGAISAICFTVFGVCCTVSTIGIVLYRRRYLNKPQTLSEPDSSVYIDDSTMRVSDNSDEMYSLDNDSFLNSLEAMTIQNYWTDTVKHTKL